MKVIKVYIMHGGLSGSVLDEVMGRAVMNSNTVTEANTMEKYDSCEGKRCFTSSEIIDENGVIMASATGIYAQISKDKSMLLSEIGQTGRQVCELSENDPKEL